MTDHQEAPRKPRSPRSFDEKLTALRDAKGAAVLRLSVRRDNKALELSVIEKELAQAQRELERAEQALNSPSFQLHVDESPQPLRVPVDEAAQ